MKDNNWWVKEANMYYESIGLDIPEDLRDTPEAIHDVLGDWLYDRGLPHEDIDKVCNMVVKMRLGVEA
jgi:hypothetical protein